MIIREPARKTLNQVASKALDFVARRFGTGPFWINKTQHSMDWAGISGSPTAFTRWWTAVALFILASLLLDKRADIRRARCLWSFSYALQMPQELIHRSNGRRYHSVVVLMAYQVLPESTHNR